MNQLRYLTRESFEFSKSLVLSAVYTTALVVSFILDILISVGSIINIVKRFYKWMYEIPYSSKVNLTDQMLDSWTLLSCLAVILRQAYVVYNRAANIEYSEGLSWLFMILICLVMAVLFLCTLLFEKSSDSVYKPFSNITISFNKLIDNLFTLTSFPVRIVMDLSQGRLSVNDESPIKKLDGILHYSAMSCTFWLSCIFLNTIKVVVLDISKDTPLFILTLILSVSMISHSFYFVKSININ